MNSLIRRAIAAAATLVISGAANAQFTTIYQTNFSAADTPPFTLGEVSGQNGWTTYDPTFTTGGGNFAKVVDTDPFGLPFTALQLDSGTSATSSPRFAWPASISAGVGQSTEVRAYCGIWRPSGVASAARQGMVLYDTTGSKLLAGFYVQADTGIVYLLAYYNNAGTLGNYAFNTNVVMSGDQWVDFLVQWDKVTGRMQVFWQTRGSTTLTGFYVDGAGAGVQADEVDFYATRNGSTVATSYFFDYLAVDVKGAYDPCASTNPTLVAGANSVAMSSAAPSLAAVPFPDLPPTATTAAIFTANWFRFVPTQSGAHSISTCGSAAASRLAVYSSCAPGGTLLASADAGCPVATPNNSSLTVTLAAGVPVYVVSGYDFMVGPFTPAMPIDIVAPVAPPCPADLNNDQQVNGADLGLLLGNWGPCAGTPCLGDLNGDGVVNGADLGLLLGAWGACP